VALGGEDVAIHKAVQQRRQKSATNLGVGISFARLMFDVTVRRIRDGAGSARSSGST